MSSGGQQSNDTLYEHSIGWGLMLIVLAVLLWLFWYYYDAEVRELVRWIRWCEMWLVSWFLGEDYQITFQGSRFDWWPSFRAVDDYGKEELTYEHLSMFVALAMQPLRIPLVVLCGLGALWCITLGPNTQFRKRMGLEQLIERQSHVFPVISPFVQFNPATQPPRPPGSPVPAELPPFAEALGPEEWLAYNSIQIPDGKIDTESTLRAFRRQLGKPWRGVKGLDNHKKILLAAFCLKAARKRDQGDAMLGRLAKCWSFKGGLRLNRDSKLLREANNVLRDKNLAGKTLSQCNRHAYETTALLRALQFAREEGGVLSPGQFVWLRAYDRTLWYPLNNMGRQSYHMEALGAMSHFKAEKLTQRPIPVPKLQNALIAIQEYMNSTIARPIPALDYSKSKKRGVKKAV